MGHVLRVTVLELSAGGAGILVLTALISWALAKRSARAARHRLAAVSTRLGSDPPASESRSIEDSLARVERATDAAAEAVTDSTAEAIRTRRALDALRLGVVIVDERGDTLFTNQLASSLMDGRHGDAIAAEAVEELLEATPTGGSSERTIELYGPPRRTLVARTESIDNGTRFLGTVAVIEDVSEHRRLEEVRRDFVANVSHELKTPMGAIGLLAETLVEEDQPQVIKRMAERIHLEAFRISRVIEDLIDLSRIENESSPPREPVPLNLLLAAAAERVRTSAEQHSVEVVVDEAPPDLTVLGDRRQLTSAVYNLLDNAVKFSCEHSKVQLTGERDGPEAVVRVVDSGVGIPARDLERIFERFYRVDPGRSRTTGGTGLGLAIVRHVAANHHGSVEVESREGEGSTFALRLPLQQRANG